ncbi:MAG: polysaccharide biosynthesis C-terminal domain-containing protein [Chitinophagales bacterium]|nr:polysaccharide biosynthesis C-terminal domain-containing protein [Chitinophagales bacterium]MDW8394282.1 polysaccharide biosynthesis C-terminal domain-containing protein [Chitinophagales bacterium]
MGIVQRQSIYGSLATYAGLAIGYLNVVILYPAFLTPEQMGLTRMLIAVGLILSQFSLLGTPYALVRFFPYFANRAAAHYGLLRFMLVLLMAGYLAVMLLVLVFRQAIERMYADGAPLFNQYFYWIFPMALFMALSELFFNHCRSLLRTPVALLLREVLLRLLQSVAIGLWIVGWVNFSGFVMAFASTYILTALMLAAYLMRLGEFFYFSTVKLHEVISRSQMLRFSLLMFASGAAATYVAFIDTVMLGALRNLAETAVYSIAFTIGTLIHVPARSMNMIAVALVAEAWKRNDLSSISRLYHQTALNQLIVGSGLFLLVWINVDVLLQFLPPDYAQARWVIFIIAAGRLLDMASGINGEILASSRHARFNLLTNVLLIGIATGTNYLLIPPYGIYGAAVATAISLFAYNAVRMTFLYKKYRIHPFSQRLAWAALLTLMVFMLTFILPETANQWLTAAYRTVLIGGLFVFLVWRLRISPEISRMISAINPFFEGKR